MFTLFFWVSLILVVLDWIAVIFHWQRVRWVSRPGAMLAILLWFTQVGHWTGPLAAFGLGLFFFAGRRYSAAPA